MRLAKGTADEQVYVSRKRHEENEKIRKATEEFLKWRGWMWLHLLGPDHCKDPITVDRRIKELYEEWEQATGMEMIEYT